MLAFPWLWLPCLAAHAQSHLIAWGDNSFGQTNIPPGLTDVKAIAAGYNHCLALRSNGLVVAWGDNTLNQTNVPANVSNIVAIAAGQYHSLAVRSDGTVIGWGLNNYGQLTPPVGLNTAVSVAAGAYHSAARKSNGTVVAWGNGFQDQTNVPPGLTTVTALSAGDVHCLALKSNGRLAAWGDNASGQTNLPANLTNIMAIAAGYHHNLAVRSNGTVAAWELNVYGETTVPPGLSNVMAVSGGYFYSMALKSNGTVVVWGGTDPSITNVPAGLTNVTAIAAGNYHALALTPTPICPPGLPDNFDCRAILSGSNVAFSVSNASASREPGEPEHFGFQDAGKSLWYSWTPTFSGGAVITANSSFLTPCLAVYSGTSFPTLAGIASNNTAFSQSRVVFNATAGSNYLIVVDGTTFGGSPGFGNLNVTLNLTPPPANDAFTNRTLIPANFFETSGSFLGATRETGEPSHIGANGIPSLNQTLWWTWTAPTNLGVTSIPVRLVADAISFPPNLGVYTGTVVSSLSSVPVVSQTNGMTRVTTFVATAGTTYQIALGGSHYDYTGVNASGRYGNYRLRLNIRALTLSFANLSSVQNGDQSTTFSADLQVTNYGSATSLPLRVRVSALSGVSVLGQDSGYATNAQILLVNSNLSALAPSQSVVRRLAGVVPPPTVNPSVTLGVGYGAYGELQEQVDTNWFTLDQTLLLFGSWPDLNGNAGPGGGVIRLDPGVTGAGFNPLTGVSALGPLTVSEGSSANYFGRATYASGYLYFFTNTAWSASRFSIATNGLFTTGIVTSNSPVTLTAQYSSGGFLYSATTNVTVLNLPPPNLIQSRILTNTTFSLQVQGVPNRKHAIEAAYFLTNPISWTPLATNPLNGSGLWNFVDNLGTNRARFYRAREVP